MSKHVTAHFQNRAQAERARDALIEANVFARHITLDDEGDGRIAVSAAVQDGEAERVAGILRGQSAPNDVADGAASDEKAGMAGGPGGDFSVEDRIRPDSSATKPRDYAGDE